MRGEGSESAKICNPPKRPKKLSKPSKKPWMPSGPTTNYIVEDEREEQGEGRLHKVRLRELRWRAIVPFKTRPVDGSACIVLLSGEA